MRVLLLPIVAALAAAGATSLAAQESYPASRVTIVVPSPAGSTTDALARIVAEQLQQKWGKPVIVENNARGLNAGAEQVARALLEYYKLGVHSFLIRGFDPFEDAVDFGRELIPRLRAGAAELVVEDGATGVLIPTGDADALAAALEPLMRDPGAALAMGARGRARVLERFSLDAEAARIGDVYRPLL